MEHSFNVETAKKYGVEEAIFIKHLQFWIIKNKANGKNRKPCIINGVHCYRTFTYNSAIALSKIFLYFSESQIRRLVTSLKNKNVIIVEDIIDTGYTLKKVAETLKLRNPKVMKICTLLDKPERREVDINVDYIGFQIPDEFVVGYGIDYAQKHRNLPYVGIVKKK